MSPSPARFGVIVPVKPPARAKSRLAPLGDDVRRTLAGALARDTVTAALACPAVAVVVVVTDDPLLGRELGALGTHVVPDGAVDDLNLTLRQAGAELARLRPDLATAVLCADLPALRADELTLALSLAVPHPAAFVADAAGKGTTLLTATDPARFDPRFGPGSRRLHAEAGAHEIRDPLLATLRLDVDTPDDLEAALAAGVGSHTRRAVQGLSL